jgi:hypothetical protein
LRIFALNFAITIAFDLSHSFMLARLQQFTICGLLALGIGCATHFALRGRPLKALAVSGLFVTGHAIVLAAEFILLVFASRADPALAAGAGELAGAWRGEVVIAPQVFCW